MPLYGFNFQWMFSWAPDKAPQPPDAKALDFLAVHDLKFVRIPLDYRFWIHDFNYFTPDEGPLKVLDSYVQACRDRGFHMSLNLHRAPGYCVGRNELEKHNLWTDKEAQDAFAFQWEMFARRYKGIPNEFLSFDLVNEPPRVGRYGMTRENHAAVIRRAHAAIRAIDPARQIVIDGLRTGNEPIPELADLDAMQSGRGYEPAALTHYKAPWWQPGVGLPEPVYPGTFWYDYHWTKSSLVDYYKPWRDLEAGGVKVHIGEFGCYNQAPNDAAMRWFADLFDLYQEYRWGYALWNFEGPFGIINHGRAGAKFEPYHGYNVDRALFNLFLEHRVS